ncbi:hypothetical protein BASA50_009468 [Batrachochytrium salamandrivorans]|uniref:Uncharacterized protein n=1 Tax=Batrachochytrium salamandrivorans TaxID=1357716 RepID=A0ABQ8F128_9FUNG|nr:hypothetical protein BASA50_009468 [Batrachochytrium salamandrivorans]KAH6602543.1 hypothetical protein BASA61_001000 [Batrachochytrium salamandrivorans]KAJ1345306.1 hypothetical protein BSLG_000819 [Batrachochytrium salamandrivorans]
MAFKIDSRSLLHHQHRPQSQQHNQNRQPSFLNSPSQRQLQLDISPVLPVVTNTTQQATELSPASPVQNALQNQPVDSQSLQNSQLTYPTHDIFLDTIDQVMVSPQSFVSISLLATADQIINALQSSTPE